ncbi:MAG TPA: heme exporter protein CcmB [Candidatus Binataceae bacterium]|jgi:heme exporter protein B|nr:heme exporter protein CcmB [Candidatus Binataceae bacterium]
MGAFGALLRKDLRLELRAGETVLTLIGLSILILVAIVFAFNPVGGAQDAATAAGALWVAMIFAGTAGATQALAAERENGCLRALLVSPLDRALLFFAKMTADLVFIAVGQTVAVIILVLFFNLDFDRRLAAMALPLALGIIGFAALTTLLAGIAGRLRAGALLLPLLAVPLFVPALIAGVKASALALAGAPLADRLIWFKILVAFDVLFTSAGYMLFESVVTEG